MICFLRGPVAPIPYRLGITIRGKGTEMATLALLGQFFVGVGILLIGCAAIWFVSIYQEREK